MQPPQLSRQNSIRIGLFSFVAFSKASEYESASVAKSQEAENNRNIAVSTFLILFLPSLQFFPELILPYLLPYEYIVVSKITTTLKAGEQSTLSNLLFLFHVYFYLNHEVH